MAEPEGAADHWRAVALAMAAACAQQQSSAAYVRPRQLAGVDGAQTAAWDEAVAKCVTGDHIPR